MGKKLFYSLELWKSIIPNYSGFLLVGQNDSLDVHIIYEIFVQFKKGRIDPHFLVIIWLMDINCDALITEEYFLELIKPFADFCVNH